MPDTIFVVMLENDTGFWQDWGRTLDEAIQNLRDNCCNDTAMPDHVYIAQRKKFNVQYTISD
jgi:hypothetical protein